MNIGEAARISGISSKMIRHYESIGLIAPSLRTEAGYRIYDDNDVHILLFIKRARSLGFALDQIKHLLSLWQDKARTSAAVKALTLEHITTLTAKIEELTGMRDALQNLVDHCQGDGRPQCPIISDLSISDLSITSQPVSDLPHH